MFLDVLVLASLGLGMLSESWVPILFTFLLTLMRVCVRIGRWSRSSGS